MTHTDDVMLSQASTCLFVQLLLPGLHFFISPKDPNSSFKMQFLRDLFPGPFPAVSPLFAPTAHYIFFIITFFFCIIYTYMYV